MPVLRAKAEVRVGADIGPMSRQNIDPTSRQNEDRFRRLLEAAPDAILEVDADGRITLVNAAAERVFGYDRTELIGQSMEMLVPETRRSKHAQRRAAYAQNPRSRPMGAGLELEAQRRDGTLFPVEISLSPNRSHEAANVIAIVRDVSQRNQMEAICAIPRHGCGRRRSLKRWDDSPAGWRTNSTTCSP
jgi:PAS domain S-box-containing protein